MSASSLNRKVAEVQKAKKVLLVLKEYKVHKVQLVLKVHKVYKVLMVILVVTRLIIHLIRVLQLQIRARVKLD